MANVGKLVRDNTTGKLARHPTSGKLVRYLEKWPAAWEEADGVDVYWEYWVENDYEYFDGQTTFHLTHQGSDVYLYRDGLHFNDFVVREIQVYPFGDGYECSILIAVYAKWDNTWLKQGETNHTSYRADLFGLYGNHMCDVVSGSGSCNVTKVEVKKP